MINLPNSAKVHRIIPKDALYKHMNLNAKLKESFVIGVEHIYVEYVLTQNSLNLLPDSEGEEILVLQVELKGNDLNSKILEEIARQNPHRLIFYLDNGDKCQLAVYQGKLYRSEWKDKEDLTLEAQGLSLEEIWESMINQITLTTKINPNLDNLSIEEKLKIQDRINTLEKQIKRKETAVWKEIQPKKKFELNTELKKLRKELEDLVYG